MAGAKVRITGSERTFDAPDGEDLLDVLLSNGCPIETACGGVASCGLCRVVIERGSELLSTIRAEEVDHFGTEAQTLGARLACQAKVCVRRAPLEAEIRVRVPPHEPLGGR